MHADQLEKLEQTLGGMRKTLDSQSKLIHLCLLQLKGMQNDELPPPPGIHRKVLDVVLTMIHVTGISSNSLLKLTKEIGLHARDGYPIARGIVESVVNVCYILAEGLKAAEQADRHAQQKAFRDLSRESAIAGVSISVAWNGALSSADQVRLSTLAKRVFDK